MPIPHLDRLATLTIPGEGHRNEYGEWVPGAPVERKIWVRLAALDAERDVLPEGARAIGDVKLLARFRDDTVSQTDFSDWLIALDGESYAVSAARELPDERREFMAIFGTRST